MARAASSGSSKGSRRRTTTRTRRRRASASSRKKKPSSRKASTIRKPRTRRATSSSSRGGGKKYGIVHTSSDESSSSDSGDVTTSDSGDGSIDGVAGNPTLAYNLSTARRVRRDLDAARVAAQRAYGRRSAFPMALANNPHVLMTTDGRLVTHPALLGGAYDSGSDADTTTSSGTSSGTSATSSDSDTSDSGGGLVMPVMKKRWEAHVDLVTGEPLSSLRFRDPVSAAREVGAQRIVERDLYTNKPALVRVGGRRGKKNNKKKTKSKKRRRRRRR